MTGIDTDFYVFEYVKPDLTMQCVSPLSSAISTFIRAQITRACRTRADEWNTNPKFAVEHNEKMLNNQLAETVSYPPHQFAKF